MPDSLIGKRNERAWVLKWYRQQQRDAITFVDRIPGLNTAPQWHDIRNNADVERISRERIDKAENSERVYNEREARIRYAITHHSVTQSVVTMPKPITGPALILHAIAHVSNDKSAVALLYKMFDICTGARKV